VGRRLLALSLLFVKDDESLRIEALDCTIEPDAIVVLILVTGPGLMDPLFSLGPVAVGVTIGLPRAEVDGAKTALDQGSLDFSHDPIVWSGLQHRKDIARIAIELTVHSNVATVLSLVSNRAVGRHLSSPSGL